MRERTFMVWLRLLAGALLILVGFVVLVASLAKAAWG